MKETNVLQVEVKLEIQTSLIFAKQINDTSCSQQIQDSEQVVKNKLLFQQFRKGNYAKISIIYL